MWIKTDERDSAPRLASWSSGEGEIPLVVPEGSLIGPDLGSLTEGRRVICYDGRGEGRSDSIGDTEEIGVDVDVRDLEALRVSLGAEKISLLGWSYWGGVSARYALTHPERVERLVLIAPLPISRDPHYAAFVERARSRFDVKGLAELRKMMESGAHERNPRRFAEKYTRYYLEQYVVDDRSLDRMRGEPTPEPNSDPIATAERGQRKMQQLGEWDWHAEFAELRVPTLVVTGSEDVIPIESSEDWAETLPEGRLLVLENCGHLPWLEMPERFAPAVAQFLDD